MDLSSSKDRNESFHLNGSEAVSLIFLNATLYVSRWRSTNLSSEKKFCALSKKKKTKIVSMLFGLYLTSF